MPDAHRGDAKRARPNATDLDREVARHQRLPLVIPDRTRCVLHLLQASAPAGSRTPDHVLTTIASGRSAAGVPRATHSAWLDPADRIQASLPRGLYWAQYPVVGEPRYRFVGSQPIPVVAFDVPTGRTRLDDLSEIAARTDAVVVHLPRGWDDEDPHVAREAMGWATLAEAVAGAMPEDATFVMVDDAGSVVGGMVELRALRAAVAPWHRFAYSYAANFSAIAYRALAVAVSEPDAEAHAFHRSVRPTVPDDAAAHNRILVDWVGRRQAAFWMTHPFTLQALYDLRRRDKAPLRRRLHDLDPFEWQHDLVCPGSGPYAVWRGTGRHAPRRLSTSTVGGVAMALADHGLLRLDGQAIAPSRTALTFLDLLHPDCEDPDMPARWQAMPQGREAREAMDAWITRTFRRMKARVNNLGEAA